MVSYHTDELRIKRNELIYKLLEQMMVDLTVDTREELAILLSRTHDLGEQLYRRARRAAAELAWGSAEEDQC